MGLAASVDLHALVQAQVPQRCSLSGGGGLRLCPVAPPARSIARHLTLLFAFLLLVACDLGEQGPQPGGTPQTSATSTFAPPEPTPSPPPAIAAPPGSGLIYVKNGALIFLDVEQRAEKTLVEAAPEAGVLSFVLSPRGDRLAYVAGGTAGAGLWILDLARPRERSRLVELPSAVAAGRVPEVVFSPDGTRLAVAATNRQAATSELVLLDLAAENPQPRRLAAAPGEYIASPVWSPDGQAVAFIQGERAGGFGYNASVLVAPLRAGADVLTVARGDALPGERVAIPPFDPTWVSSGTLAFQEWGHAQAPQGTWVASLAGPSITPRLLVSNQLGLASWSAPVAGGRLLAYRAPGEGLFVAGLESVQLVAAEPGAGSTGAFPPLWSADARYIAFATTGNRLLFADRLAPGAGTSAQGQAGRSVLRAAWNGAAGEDARLAALGGRQLEIYAPEGQLLAALEHQLPGSPQQILWQPGATGPLRLVLRAAAADESSFALIEYDDGTRRPELIGSWTLEDGAPLQWIQQR